MKKAMMAFQIIVIVVILLVVAALVLFVFKDYFWKETEVIGEQISSLGDCDCDGIRNFLDKCPCIPFTEGAESEEYAGCPDNVNEPQPCTAELAKLCKEQGNIGEHSKLCPK